MFGKKVKYFYEEETATYKPIKKGKKRVIGQVGLFLLAALIFGFLINIISSSFIPSPTEMKQNRDLKFMARQYSLLNKKFDEVSKVLQQLEERDNNIYRVYFEAQPISEDIRKAGFGGNDRYKYLEGYKYSDLVKETSKKLDIISKQIVIQSKSLDEIIELAKNKEEILAEIPAIQPVAKKDLKRIASGFGARMHPILKIRKMHWGIDFSADRGAPVYATADGVVSKATPGSGYGNVVEIDHGNGYVTRYAHLSAFRTSQGKKVKRGDIIGLVGSTGLSTGPHLHYEIEKNGEKIDPVYFFYKDLSPDDYTSLINQSNLSSQSLD